MLTRVTQLSVLLPVLLLSANGQPPSGGTTSGGRAQKGGQIEAAGGVPVEVVSGTQHNSDSCGLVGCNEGTSYVVRSTDVMFFLSCKREVVWEAKCPVLAAGEKFSLAIDAKNHVHLTGTRVGKPVDIKLEYEESRKLPSGNSPAVASAAAPQTPSADLATVPISDSGNAFLAQCDTSGDAIGKEACNVWVDGFMNGLVTGMAAATPGEAEFDTEKNGIVCFTKTAMFGQVFPLILKYIRDHPAERKDPTAVLAFSALQEAFPCKQ